MDAMKSYCIHILLQIEVIRMYKQLDFFEEYQKRVSDLIGKKEAKKLINGALILITCGGNDFVNNYYLVPNSLRSRQYALPEYVTYLLSEYKKILRVIFIFYVCMLFFELK